MRTLADPIPINTADEGMARIALLLLALFAEMERTFTAERAARAVDETTKGRHIGRPNAWPDDKIDYARLPREQGSSLGEFTGKTGIPRHRCTATSRQPPDRSDPARYLWAEQHFMYLVTRSLTAPCLAGHILGTAPGWSEPGWARLFEPLATRSPSCGATTSRTAISSATPAVRGWGGLRHAKARAYETAAQAAH